MTNEEHLLAFVTPVTEPPGLAITINFGMFAGREATPAEVDELARVLLGMVDSISIVSEQRHEIGRHVGASVHQVRVEVGADALPQGDDERSALEQRLVGAAEAWAASCIADRHAEVSEL